MKSRLSIGTAVAALLMGCWGVELFAAPVLEPAQPQEVQLSLLDTHRPEEIGPEPEQMAVAPRPAPLGELPGALSLNPARLKFVLAGLWMRGMSVVASSAPPAGVRSFPPQPRLDVSWSLQGMADEESQGGEGDVVDYDG